MQFGSGFKSPIAAATLSAIWPGLGQVAAGHSRRGLIVMIPTLALVFAMMLIVVVDGPDTLFGLSVNQGWLTSLLLLDLIFFLYHVWAMVDAYLLARGTVSRKRRMPATQAKLTSVAVVAILISSCTVGVHAGFAYMDMSWQHSLYCLDAAHQGGDCAGPNNGQIADASNDPYAASLNLDSLGPSGSLGTIKPIYSIDPNATLDSFSTTTEAEHWADDGQLNVLLLGVGVGGDARCPAPNSDLPCRLGPDTLMVLHVDLDSGKAAMISVGRNIICTPLPAEIAAHFTKESVCPPGQYPAMINSIGTLAWTACGKVPYYPESCGQDRDESAYLRAMTAFERTIGNLLGVTIDGSVTINPQGLTTLIDDLGGVDLTVATKLYDKPCGPAGTWQRDIGTTIAVPGNGTCAQAHNGYSVPSGPAGVQKMRDTASASGGSIVWQQGQDIAFIISTGTHHMSGDWALAYSRTRIYTNDFSRQGRQQELLRALRAGLDPCSVATRLPSLLSHISWAFKTDLPLNSSDDLKAFANLAKNVTGANVKSIVLQPTEIGMPYVGGYPAVDSASWTKIKNIVAHSLDSVPAPSGGGGGGGGGIC